jgi:competence protein ComEA
MWRWRRFCGTTYGTDMPTRYWAGAAGLAAVVLLAAFWFGRSGPMPAPLLVDVGPDAPEATITVHVAGEVALPGLVSVAAHGRVADAVAGAGGATRDADLSQLNLAAPLRDGDQIIVPGTQVAVSVDAAMASDGRVRINRASVSQLEQLPGVGPVLADRIASYRDENGPFATVEDLLDVPGIGEAKLAGLRDSVAIP